MTPRADDRAALSRAWMRGLREGGLAWVRNGCHANETEAYADLIFAFGAASVGDTEQGASVLVERWPALSEIDQAHRECFAAYEYRIREALAGRPHAGALPAALMERLGGMQPLERFIVDRLRKQSIVVEPDQPVNPYGAWSPRVNDFERALLEARELLEPAEFERAIEALERRAPPDEQYRVWALVLGRASVAPPGLLRKAIRRTRSLWGKRPRPSRVDEILAHSSALIDGLTASARARLEDVAPELLRAAASWLPAVLAANPAAANRLISAAVNALWEFRMGEEADEFLNVATAATTALEPPHRLHPLLAVADGWYRFGFDRLAEPAVMSARGTASSGQLDAREQVSLLRALAAAVRNAPQPVADLNFSHTFTLPAVRDTYTTSTHFRVGTLEVIEAVVLSAVNVCRITDTWNIPPRG